MVEQVENKEEAQTEETSTGKAIPEIDSKYRMIILAAQRSKQLQRGATPRVDADMRKQKPTRVAMREIQKKKIDFDILES
ncbi:MAG: DNA-directed polymerase subunit omega [Acidobacteria bacterium]|jgi:DNA-directed RNA polymerase omega subunit|nr:DNA-directed polymerase subunit omega [Acidobacteriota bacterium]